MPTRCRRPGSGTCRFSTNPFCGFSERTLAEGGAHNGVLPVPRPLHDPGVEQQHGYGRGTFSTTPPSFNLSVDGTHTLGWSSTIRARSRDTGLAYGAKVGPDRGADAPRIVAALEATIPGAGRRRLRKLRRPRP